MRLQRSARILGAAIVALTLGCAPAGAATAQWTVPGLDMSSQAAVALNGAELPEVTGGVDLDSYMGTWQQVAAIPQPYTLQCVKNTTAQYQRLNDTTVSVKNACEDFFGKRSVVEGKARVKGPASLRVAFGNVPFQSAEGPVNYRVTYFNADKTIAVVGDPGRKSGFVLSRTASLNAAQWSQVRDAIAQRGWNPCFFLTTPTQGGRPDVKPLCTL